MYDILLIEDDLQIAYAIESMLREKYPRCNVEKAINFYRAEGALKRYLNSKSCRLIISDLHMPDEGLRPSGDRPDGAVLNGWVFLRDYLLQKNSQYHDICKQARIIIFSAFLKELREYADESKVDADLLLDINQVEKGRIYTGQGGYDKLMAEIENLLISN